jgi:hypothetical protein
MFDVYLSLAETVTAEKRDQFLTQLKRSLSPSMELTDRHGQACVRCHDAADPTGAVISVQRRAKPILEELGLADEQVSWSNESKSI